jgi:hypothetical protein
MDYLKIHNAIIKRSRERTLSCYTEKHHIIPRCMGGGNELTNIAILTPEEHFVVHQLLVKIYPNNYKLVCACQAMGMNSNGQKNGAKMYGWIKNKISQAKSIETRGEKNPHFGKKHSLEARRKISEGHKGKFCSDEEKQEMSLRMMGNQRGLGYKHSDESKKNMSDRRKGGKHHLFGIGHTEESKLKMRESKKKKSKAVIQFSLDGEEICRFPSIKEAERLTGIFTQSISPVCKGKYKQAGGFRWSFADNKI